MEESDISRKLEEQDKKLDKIYRSVEKTRKYFLWTLLISVAFVVLPLLVLIVMILQILSYYSSLSDLGL